MVVEGEWRAVMMDRPHSQWHSQWHQQRVVQAMHVRFSGRLQQDWFSGDTTRVTRLGQAWSRARIVAARSRPWIGAAVDREMSKGACLHSEIDRQPAASLVVLVVVVVPRALRTDRLVGKKVARCESRPQESAVGQARLHSMEIEMGICRSACHSASLLVRRPAVL